MLVSSLLILRLWRWKRHVPSKRQLIFNGLLRYSPELFDLKFVIFGKGVPDSLNDSLYRTC
jgi:hypothetical protein